MTDLRWPEKRAGAVYDYALDFRYRINRDGSPLMADQDYITEAYEPTVEGDVVVRDYGHTQTEIVVWLAGGTGTNTVRLTGKTALGRELDEEVKINVLP